MSQEKGIGERPIGELVREGKEWLRALARRYPWWPVAVLLAYVGWWGITKIETQRFCLEAGYTDSAVAWDTSAFCVHHSGTYGDRAVPVEKVKPAPTR